VTKSAQRNKRRCIGITTRAGGLTAWGCLLACPDVPGPRSAAEGAPGPHVVGGEVSEIPRSVGGNRPASPTRLSRASADAGLARSVDDPGVLPGLYRVAGGRETFSLRPGMIGSGWDDVFLMGRKLGLASRGEATSLKEGSGGDVRADRDQHRFPDAPGASRRASLWCSRASRSGSSPVKPGTTHAWVSLQMARCSISWSQTGKEVKCGSVFEVMILPHHHDSRGFSRLRCLSRGTTAVPTAEQTRTGSASTSAAESLTW